MCEFWKGSKLFLLRVNQQFLKPPSVQTSVAVLPEVSQYQNVTVPEYFEKKSTVEALPSVWLIKRLAAQSCVHEATAEL